MTRDKATMIAEIVKREATDAINGVIADYPEHGLALRTTKDWLLSRIEMRMHRRYVTLEILDTAEWNKRKVGNDPK